MANVFLLWTVILTMKHFAPGGEERIQVTTSMGCSNKSCGLGRNQNAGGPYDLKATMRDTSGGSMSVLIEFGITDQGNPVSIQEMIKSGLALGLGTVPGICIGTQKMFKRFMYSYKTTSDHLHCSYPFLSHRHL